ncbi:hypothetical protein Tco_1357854 [Tanacetum coccineum]
MSSSSTVTYTSVYTDSEPWRFYWVSDDELEAPEEARIPEYLVPYDAEAPIEDQPLPDDASPIALSPGYVVDSDPEEDPEEDPAEYLTDGGDDDDDDDDDDDEDDDDDDDEDDEEDEEEEENLAPADSTALHVTPMSATAEALIVEYAFAPTPPSPPPFPLTPLSSPLPQIPSPPLPLPLLPTYTS